MSGGLKRTLTVWDLVFYGIVIIQPVAPMGVFGLVSIQARGHVVTTILIGMCAMLLTAVSYGKLAAAHPSAGSAFTYVARELHPIAGYSVGWAMILDYVLNPVICTILCSKLAVNYLPAVPYAAWVLLFAMLFTTLNLQRVKQSARTSQVLVVIMSVVVVVFLAAALRYLLARPLAAGDLLRPFYDPTTFSFSLVLGGASIAALTYIGFDGISTLAEEVENPRRNVLRATVYTCLAIGLLAAIEVYAAQLVWGTWSGYPDVDTAFVHVARKAGGEWLFILVSLTLLVANVGSGTNAQLAAARLLLGMGRSGALPAAFFGSVDAAHGIPRNNVLAVGALAIAGAFVLSYQAGAELLNCGAFIAFMSVNLAAFARAWIHASRRTAVSVLAPLLGFAFCAYLFYGLRPAAQLAGGAWLAVGLLYGAIRTKGFSRPLEQFDPARE